MNSHSDLDQCGHNLEFQNEGLVPFHMHSKSAHHNVVISPSRYLTIGSLFLFQQKVEFEIRCMICTSMAVNAKTKEPVSYY